MGEMAANIARLPELLALAEKSASMLADGRVRLHPETVQALRGRNGGRTSLILIWVVLAALIGVVLFG
jgi:ubiquinone biosynthesis protein